MTPAVIVPARGAARPTPHGRYDALSIAVHWTTLALVLAQFGTAWSLAHVAPPLVHATLTAHRSMGVALWLLTFARLAWRRTGMRRPSHPRPMRRWMELAAAANHLALYALLLLQPLTGLADSLWRERPFQLFAWQVPAMLHRSHALASEAHRLHVMGAYLLAAAVALHAGAALVHAWLLRDGVLPAMWLGDAAAGADERGSGWKRPRGYGRR